MGRPDQTIQPHLGFSMRKKGGGIDMQVKSKGKDVCVFSLQ